MPQSPGTGRPCSSPSSISLWSEDPGSPMVRVFLMSLVLDLYSTSMMSALLSLPTSSIVLKIVDIKSLFLWW